MHANSRSHFEKFSLNPARTNPVHCSGEGRILALVLGVTLQCDPKVAQCPYLRHTRDEPGRFGHHLQGECEISFVEEPFL